MTTRDSIHKWFIYALALLPVWILDGMVLPRYPLGGVTPMLLPAAVAAVAVLEGGFAGTGFGMAVGLLWELAYPGGFGIMVAAMALAGMLIGISAQYSLSQGLPACLLCTGCLLAVMDGLRILKGLITNSAGLAAMLQVAVPEVLLSLCWTPVVWLLFHAVFRRVGGTKLA